MDFMFSKLYVRDYMCLMFMMSKLLICIVFFLIFCWNVGASKAGGAEREAIEDVIRMMRVPVKRVRPPLSTASSSHMKLEQLERNLAAVEDLVHIL